MAEGEKEVEVSNLFLLVSHRHTQWVLNARPHSPPSIYKGRSCQL